MNTSTFFEGLVHEDRVHRSIYTDAAIFERETSLASRSTPIAPFHDLVRQLRSPIMGPHLTEKHRLESGCIIVCQVYVGCRHLLPIFTLV